MRRQHSLLFMGAVLLLAVCRCFGFTADTEATLTPHYPDSFNIPTTIRDKVAEKSTHNIKLVLHLTKGHEINTTGGPCSLYKDEANYWTGARTGETFVGIFYTTGGEGFAFAPVPQNAGYVYYTVKFHDEDAVLHTVSCTVKVLGVDPAPTSLTWAHNSADETKGEYHEGGTTWLKVHFQPDADAIGGCFSFYKDTGGGHSTGYDIGSWYNNDTGTWQTSSTSATIYYDNETDHTGQHKRFTVKPSTGNDQNGDHWLGQINFREADPINPTANTEIIIDGSQSLDHNNT